MKILILFFLIMGVTPLFAVHKRSTDDSETARYPRNTNCTAEVCELGAKVMADKDAVVDADSSCAAFKKANVATNSRPIFLKFTAEWCGPCQEIKKLMTDEFKAQYEVDFMEIDVDLCPELADKYDVKAIPKGIVFKNGIRGQASTNGLSLATIDDFLKLYRVKKE